MNSKLDAFMYVISSYTHSSSLITAPMCLTCECLILKVILDQW